jgi:hypothetical protein
VQRYNDFQKPPNFHAAVMLKYARFLIPAAVNLCKQHIYAVFVPQNANMHHDMHETMHDFAVFKLCLSSLRTLAQQPSDLLNIPTQFDWFHSQNITVQHFNFITLRIFQVAEIM